VTGGRCLTSSTQQVILPGCSCHRGCFLLSRYHWGLFTYRCTCLCHKMAAYTKRSSDSYIASHNKIANPTFNIQFIRTQILYEFINLN